MYNYIYNITYANIIYIAYNILNNNINLNYNDYINVTFIFYIYLQTNEENKYLKLYFLCF